MRGPWIEGEIPYFWQWDLHRRMVMETPQSCTFQYAQAGSETETLLVEPVREGERLFAPVPHILLQTAAPITVYICDEQGHTIAHTVCNVAAREKPTDYVYTETEVQTWESLRIYCEEQATATAQALFARAENGEFDGPQGPAGEPGLTGYTPQRGVDYWTELDKEEIAGKALDKLQIGGRNLLLNSGVEHTSGDYRIAGYTPSSPLVAGETYTVSMEMTPAAGISKVAVYLSAGLYPNVYLQTNGTEKQVLSGSFTAKYYSGHTPDDNTGNAILDFYRLPNDGTVTGATTIHWVKVEKGNKATDWTPAPEDIEARVATVESKIKNHVTQAQVDAAVEGVQIGGRNYIRNSAQLSVSGLGTDGSIQKEYKAMNVGQGYTNIPGGTTITISFDVEMVVNTAKPYIQVYNYNNKGPKDIGYKDVAFDAAIGDVIKKRCSVKTTLVDRSDATITDNYIEFYSGYGTSNWFKISNPKLEIGNKPTDWTPAPEDVESMINERIPEQSEIVNEVLAALPVWTGGSY